MEIVVGVVFLLVLGGLIAATRGEDPYVTALCSAARELGLEVVPGGLWPRAVGNVEGYSVMIERRLQSDGRTPHSVTRFWIRTDLPPSTFIGREGLLSAAVKIVTGPDIETDVENFDSVCRIRADDEVDMVSRLGSEARGAVLSLLCSHALVGAISEDIQLSYRGAISSAETMATTIRNLVAAAQALGTKEATVEQRLARLATTDPVKSFRCRCLRLLVKHFAGTAEAKAALKRALADPDLEIRLLAGRHAPAADIVEPLREIALDADLSESVRAPALRILTERHPSGLDPARLVEELLPTAHDLLLGAILDFASARGHSLAIAPLAEKLIGASPEAKEAIATALAGHPGADSEAVLLSMLAPAQSAVCSAAAQTLGRVGSIRAVEPLMECARGLITAREIKAAAKQAIAAIQSRLVLGERGALAIVNASDSESGALALADGSTSGAVSLSQDSAIPPARRK